MFIHAIVSMNYTEDDKLTCGFWLMNKKVVFGFDDDFLVMELDNFSIWEGVSLGSLVEHHEFTLIWRVIVTCVGGWPLHTFPRGGRCHPPIHKIYGMEFWNQYLIFPRPKKF